MKSLSFGILMSLITLSVSTSYGQNTKDPKAQEILKGVSSKYKSCKSISVSFKFSSIDQKTKKNDSQAGSLVVKGNKYKLNLKGQEVISDSKTVWTYLKESNEVQINDASEKSDAISPTNIFTIYEKGFSSKFIGEKTTDNVLLQQVELVPDDSKKSYFKIQLFIDKKQRIINSAKIFDKNGTIYTYAIEKFKSDVEAPDSMFSFDKAKYPGAEIVDLR